MKKNVHQHKTPQANSARDRDAIFFETKELDDIIKEGEALEQELPHDSFLKISQNQAKTRRLSLQDKLPGENYRGFKFRHSANTGGKAGKGHNKTRSIHLTSLTYFKGRYFSYNVGDAAGYYCAIAKAKTWIANFIKSLSGNADGPPVL